MRKLLLLLCLVPCLSNASDWKLLHSEMKNYRVYKSGEDRTGVMKLSNYSVYVDKASIVTVNALQIQAWMKITASADGYLSDVIGLTEFDCITRNYTSVDSGSRKSFSDPYEMLSDTFDLSQKPKRVFDIPPDSAVEYVWNAVCKNKWSQN